ncbi:MAG TPA: histidine kinase, partial [Flavisolibacter sp.]|nr:histidine kinase [Flavisolibacter sp.]
KPVLLNIYTADELNIFLKRLRSSSSQLEAGEINKWKENYGSENLDSQTNLPKKLTLQPDENSLIFYLKNQIDKKEDLEYRLILHGEPYVNWKPNDFDNGFIWIKDLPPGKYRIDMRLKAQPANVISYPFDIKPRWDQTLSFKIMAGGSIAAFFGFILLLIRLRQQRKKLRAAQERKYRLETELRSIRSQLNPHFIFNALGSIQGLINRNLPDKANYYLSGFSTLLRESLEHGDRQNLPLVRELKMLENYIQLEQLRFHFKYDISIDPALDLHAIEIPSLLLQPLVENAIRHGIASLHEQGEMKISLWKAENCLCIGIRDNGKGFDKNAVVTGFGLRLTRERIALLNGEKGSQMIRMNIDTQAGQGTNIILKFENTTA